MSTHPTPNVVRIVYVNELGDIPSKIYKDIKQVSLWYKDGVWALFQLDNRIHFERFDLVLRVEVFDPMSYEEPAYTPMLRKEDY